MRRLRLRLLVGSVVLAVVAIGCGQSSPPAYDPAAVELLQRDLSAVDTALEANRPAAARRALDQLTEDLTIELEAGRVPADKAAEIRSALATLEAGLATPTVTTPTTTPTPTEPTKADDHHGKDGKGRHKGEDG